MSLQDDIFDVEAALKGKPEAAQFDRVHQALADTERTAEGAVKMLKDIKTGASAFQKLLELEI